MSDCNHDERFLQWEDHRQPIRCALCEIERLRAGLGAADTERTIREAYVSMIEKQLAECRRLVQEACEAWRGGSAHYPVPMGEVFNGAVLSKSWYKRAVAAGGGG